MANYLGIFYEASLLPALDPGYIPVYAWNRAYLSEATEPVAIALERNNGLVNVYRTHIRGTEASFAADVRYLERTVKFLLWSRGGWRISICGGGRVAEAVAAQYRADAQRGFDAAFMAGVYQAPLTVEVLPLSSCPAVCEHAAPVGRHLSGCRIGFDAGGSDRKVSAVCDGEPVYSEEVVWFPKQNSDPQYHFDGIVSALKTAASKMPRVDAIGVSSAGVYVDNHTRVASLFRLVPEDRFEREVQDIYLRAAAEIGDVPLVVANDGDVSALAGAMSLGSGRVFGLAMGTSEATGYVNEAGNIAGWLNELAFAPVDLNPAAIEDEWSGDLGVGVKYFSQDAVIKLASAAGLALPADAPLAEQLRFVQQRMEEGSQEAAAIYTSIGRYLGHTLPLYAEYYDILHVLLLGRVTSGKGGDRLLEACNEVLTACYPALAARIVVQLPSESSRRIGQSVAAASLPAIPGLD